MPSAEPWGKLVWSTSSKASSVRPLNPGPNSMSGFASVQVPKSRAEFVVVVEVELATLDETTVAVADSTLEASMDVAATAADELKLVTVALCCAALH